MSELSENITKDTSNIVEAKETKKRLGVREAVKRIEEANLARRVEEAMRFEGARQINETKEVEEEKVLVKRSKHTKKESRDKVMEDATIQALMTLTNLRTGFVDTHGLFRRAAEIETTKGLAESNAGREESTMGTLKKDRDEVEDGIENAMTAQGGFLSGDDEPVLE
ncbi:hypothetical protein Landi51_12370 [Colletotrichum acutatum]